MLVKGSDKSGGPVDAQARSFERPFNRVATNMQDHPGAWLGAFTLVYFACTFAHALAKRLWFDELCTLYVARIPGWKERFAISSESPPLFYFLTRASLRLVGWNALGARLPEILGFWLMCICLFLFVRRRCPVIYAFLAMVIPVGTAAYYYSCEARPYGMMLGMAALSLWCWQSSVDGVDRKGALLLLTLSIAFAVNVHFLGGQIVIPLLAGEAYRAVGRRKIDWGVLGAIVLGLTPLTILLALLRSAQGSRPWLDLARNSPAFWAKPHALSLVIFYRNLLVPILPSFVIGTIVVFLVFALEIKKPIRQSRSAPRFPMHEIVAGIGYLLIPPVLIVLTWLKTGYFMDRYAITAVVGCAILLAFLSNILFFDRARTPVLYIAILLCFWITNAATASRQEFDPLKDFSASSPLYPRHDRLPIVVADAVLFSQVAHYAPPEVRSRLVYLTDPTDAVRRPDFIPELALATHRDLVPGDIEDYAPFLNRNRQFWLYCHGVPRLEWLPSRLRQEGWRLGEEARNGSSVFFRVSQSDAASNSDKRRP